MSRWLPRAIVFLGEEQGSDELEIAEIEGTGALVERQRERERESAEARVGGGRVRRSTWGGRREREKKGSSLAGWLAG